MSELAAVLKSLRKVDPGVAAELEYSVDKNLLRNHPGLFNSSVMWYGGKMNNYLNEVTKNDASQYAIAVMDPDELAKVVGRANMEDPAVRDRVLDLYNRATSSPDGLRSIVKLDGLVNEKGYIDVTKITPGSQETAEALRLLDRDRLPDMPPAKVPVLVQASGAKWATDPAPRLRYNGQTSGTLDMPRWTNRRPPPLTKAVADATSPSFYKDQPQNPFDVASKVATFYDPHATLAHGQAVKQAQSSGALEQYAFNISNTKPIPKYQVDEATTFRNARRDRMMEILDPIVEEYGHDFIKSLVGKDNIFKMKLMGATGPDAELPIVWTRSDKYGVVPVKEGEFSISITRPRETGMHAGEPVTMKSFQGNNFYHDYQLGLSEMKKYPKDSPAYKQAERAVSLFEQRRKTFTNNLDMTIKKAFPEGISKQNIEAILFDSMIEAKDKFLASRRPGDKTSIFTATDGHDFIKKALKSRLPGEHTDAQLDFIAADLRELTGLADNRGGTTRPFMLKNVKRPIFLVDVGGFEPSIVLKQLMDMPEFGDDARRILNSTDPFDTEASSLKVQKLLESRGYDAAIYLNTTAEGSDLTRYANPMLRNPAAPQGYSPSIFIWKQDQIVPLDDPKMFPGKGNNTLKKALSALLVAPAGTKDKEDGSSN